VLTLTADQLAAVPTFSPSWSDVGAFRTSVPFSHISNDDPIVYPGVPGAAHLHTFSGNATVSASSTYDSLRACTTSTGSGGTLNCTGYWFPTMIDTRTGQPIVPLASNFYYKSGYQSVDATKIQPFPAGLRMIAGNPAQTSALPSWAFHPGSFRCVGGPNGQNVGTADMIGNCDVGAQLIQSVDFPQCWDGVNLDSPDHKSHMAYGVGFVNPDGTPNGSKNGCPTTHPVALPAVTLNAQYLVTEQGIGNFWKLSSDNYAGNGGYSLHGDWFGAWDPATMQAFVKNCVAAKMDCHENLLGDGRMMY
jgi:hypothetical protein